MKLSLLIFIFPMLSTFGQTKQVCFSIDDLPVVTYGIQDTVFQKKVTEDLVFSLKRNHIPAIGFVMGNKLTEGGKISFQAGLLNIWLEHGLELGNHTYSHPDINKVSINRYAADILKGEKIMCDALGEKATKSKYFRHPFLHVGNTKAKADSLENFLRDFGYTIAPVTIDNDDYLFALAYYRAMEKKDEGLMIRIGQDYISYMEKKLRYYEEQSRNLFGRNISHILLLHASYLNSQYIDSLAIMYSRNNYMFVSMDTALKDEAFTSDISFYGNRGISWIDRWAISQGRKNSFFKDDPLTPDYIRVLAR